MQLHAPKFAFAAAIAMSTVHFIRGIFFMFWPEQALKLSAQVFHIGNTAKLQQLVNVTWGALLIGIAHLFVLVFLTTLLFAVIYNGLVGEQR